MTYTLTHGASVKRDSDGAVIPADPQNADWIAYQLWLSAGNLPSAAPPVLADVVVSVSRRQFFERAALDGLITQDEAKAAIIGTALPASLQNLVSQLPADKQFDATMKLLGAESFNLADALVPAMAQSFGWDDAKTHAFWAAAAAL